MEHARMDDQAVTPRARYAFDVDRRFLPVLLLCGYLGSRDGVTVDDKFSATLGWVRIATPLENVLDAHITERYRWWTAIGIRLSFADDGLTFGTNCRRGVCIHFREKVWSRVRPSGHSALTVTVRNPEGLVAELSRHGGDGERSGGTPPSERR